VPSEAISVRQFGLALNKSTMRIVCAPALVRDPETAQVMSILSRACGTARRVSPVSGIRRRSNSRRAGLRSVSLITACCLMADPVGL
jgi:hypothetical protein